MNSSPSVPLRGALAHRHPYHQYHQQQQQEQHQHPVFVWMNNMEEEEHEHVPPQEDPEDIQQHMGVLELDHFPLDEELAVEALPPWEPELPQPPPPPPPAQVPANMPPVRRGPTTEEVEAATTDRQRAAIHSWYDRLLDLENFRRQHGHTDVPQIYAANKKLGVWVNKQRMEYKKYVRDPSTSSLTPIKVHHLEAIEFKWAKPKGEQAWENQFAALQEYKDRHGNCNVPTKSRSQPALGRWVSTQRRRYRDGQLPPEKVARLQELGFVWRLGPEPVAAAAAAPPSRRSTRSSRRHNNDDDDEDESRRVEV